MEMDGEELDGRVGGEVEHFVSCIAVELGGR